jgi:hypothetical protein
MHPHRSRILSAIALLLLLNGSAHAACRSSQSFSSPLEAGVLHVIGQTCLTYDDKILWESVQVDGHEAYVSTHPDTPYPGVDLGKMHEELQRIMDAALSLNQRNYIRNRVLPVLRQGKVAEAELLLANVYKHRFRMTAPGSP